MRLKIWPLIWTHRAFLCDIITFKNAEENKKLFALLVYKKIVHSNLGKRYKMLLVWIESDKMPLICKLKQLCKCLLVIFSILSHSNATIVGSVPAAWDSTVPPARHQSLDQVRQQELVRVSVAGLIPRLVDWE